MLRKLKSIRFLVKDKRFVKQKRIKTFLNNNQAF
jgi:hypothetical protein